MLQYPVGLTLSGYGNGKQHIQSGSHDDYRQPSRYSAILVAAVVPLALRLGRLPTREEHAALQSEVTRNREDLKEEIANTKEELRGEITSVKEELRGEITSMKEELRGEITSMKEELRGEIASAKFETLQEIRRSHQQIMLALANHTHNNDDGQAVFALPPDVELVPSPADN